jgi:hypothetical protein
MRKMPTVKRPGQIPTRVPLGPDRIQTASYVGSAEHKKSAWWGGYPDAFVNQNGLATRPGKQLTTICPLTTEAERQTATEWVQKALQSGQLRYYEGDKDFPKRLWYRDDIGKIWMGFCVNSVLGQYKGWPSDEEDRVEIFGKLD